MKSPEGGGKGGRRKGGHKSLFTKVRDTSGPLTVPSSHPCSSGRVKRGYLLGVWYTITSRVVFLLRRFPQSRQSAKRFLKSSELGLPQPLTCRRVCPPTLWSGGEGTLAGERRGWESPNSDEKTYTVALFIYVYFVTVYP
jgi:hypothetical protein